MAFVGSLVAFFASVEQQAFFLRGYVDPTRTLDLPYRTERFGVNADLTQYDAETLTTQLELMRALNVRWIRQMISWADTEPLEGEFVWEQWDQIVDVLDDFSEFELIAVVVDAPVWARSERYIGDGDFDFAPPQHIDAFAEFVQRFAERYESRIRYYQIWDEPNIRSAWGGRDPNPTHYASLLQSAYNALHDTLPDVHVIAAALAPTVERGPRNINDIDYLRTLYALGIAEFSDSIAAKPYGFDLPADDRRVSVDVLNFSRIIALREIMVENGDGQKLLWASNWGWNASLDQSIWGNVTRPDQVTHTLSAIERVESEWPWLGGMILHTWQPVASADDPLWGFALIDAGGQPTSLYDALLLRERHHGATNGRYPARTFHASYSGAWTFADMGADIGWVQDSHIDFYFSGQTVSLITRQDDFVTNLYATVNGDPANALPGDVNGNRFLLLRSDSLQPQIENVILARNLGSGIHHLRLTADELIPDEATFRWPIVGFAVSSDDLSRPFRTQTQLATVAVIFSAIALTISVIAVDWKPVNRRLQRLWNTFDVTRQIAIGFVTSVVLMMSLFITWQEGYPQFFRRESVQIGLAIITAGLIYWNTFSPIITLLAAGLLLIIICNNVRIGLLLIVFWSPFFLFPVELYLFAFPIVEIMLWLTFAAWLLRSMVDWSHDHQILPRRYRKLNLTMMNIDYLIILWVVIGALALTWSARRDLAITDYRTLFIQPALFYIVLRTTHLDRHWLKRVITVLILSGFVVASIGVYQWFSGTFIEAEGGIRRLVSVYGSPNNAALYLGRCIPFVLAGWFIVQDRSWRMFFAVSGFVMALGILLTQSAGALFLGLPMTIIVMLVMVYGWRSLRFILPLLAIALLGLFLAAQSPRFERLLDPASGTNFYRIRVWQSAINMIADQPLTGIGLDQFLYEYRGRYIMPDAWEEPELSHPHNILLDFWLRFGVVGLPFLLLLFWQIKRAIADQLNNVNRNRDDWLRWVIVGIAGCFVYIVTHGLVDNSFFVIDLAYVFMILLGLLRATENISAVDAERQIVV